MIRDDRQDDRILHSLESVNYLRINRENFITFECADSNKILTICQEFKKEIKREVNNKEVETETGYEKIYSIKLHDLTLRELLLFKSLHVSKTQSDIVQLVKD